MVFLGRVVDNKNFGVDGTIEVLLPQKLVANGGEHILSQGLHKILQSIKKLLPKNSWSKGDKMTVSCLVNTPIGSGYNTGMFQLPQINTVGLVLQVQDYSTWSDVRYIWLGGLYGCKMYGEKVIIPNDDTVSDELNYDDKTLICEKDEKEARDTITNSDFMRKGTLIIKTKSSHIQNIDNVQLDEVDFKEIPGENTIVLNKNKIAVRHNTYSDKSKIKIQDIKLDDDKITVKKIIGKDGEKQKEQEISMLDDKMVISFSNTNGKKVSLTLDENGTLNIDASSDITVHSDAKMKFTSDDKMSFVANGKSLFKCVDTLFNDMINFDTKGSPAVHYTGLQSKINLKKNQTYFQGGYE